MMFTQFVDIRIESWCELMNFMSSWISFIGHVLKAISTGSYEFKSYDK